MFSSDILPLLEVATLFACGAICPHKASILVEGIGNKTLTDIGNFEDFVCIGSVRVRDDISPQIRIAC